MLFKSDYLQTKCKSAFSLLTSCPWTLSDRSFTSSALLLAVYDDSILQSAPAPWNHFLCHSLIFSLYPIMMLSLTLHGYTRYANFQSLSTEWFFCLACSFPSGSHLYSWGLHSKGYFLSKVFLDDPKRNWNEFTFFISSLILLFFMALVTICCVSSLVYWINKQNILSKYIN